MDRENEPMSSRSGTSGRETTQDMKAKSRQVADKVRTEVSAATERLRRRAGENVESQREQAATMVGDLGGAIRRAAEELHERNDDRVAEWAEAIAEQCEKASSYLAERDLRTLGSELSNAARRRPGLAIGGMFLVGLAAARFLKASHRDDLEDRFDAENQYGGGDAWSGGVQSRYATSAGVPRTNPGGLPGNGGFGTNPTDERRPR